MASYLSDLGFELCILLRHLFKKHEDNSDVAFCELALRTRCAYRTDDVEKAKNCLFLQDTQWYNEMAERYRHLRESLKRDHHAELKEADVVMRSLYPTGCRVKEYVDAFQTCAALLTLSIPRHVLLRFATYRAKELATQGCVTVTADELVSDFIENPLVDAITPSQWWRCDTESVSATVTVKKVGLRARPAEIHIICLWCDKLRCYRIHLDGILHESGPTAPLARRLARTHGTLLDEERFHAYLVRLQGLMKNTTANGGVLGKASDFLLDEDNQQEQLTTRAVDSKESTKIIKNTVDVVRKPDVGLLYRDPEAALENVDLNDADDITLHEFKAKMDEKFFENIVRPGDPGYQYDKRLEVKPTERCEWDDSD